MWPHHQGRVSQYLSSQHGQDVCGLDVQDCGLCWSFYNVPSYKWPITENCSRSARRLPKAWNEWLSRPPRAYALPTGSHTIVKSAEVQNNLTNTKSSLVKIGNKRSLCACEEAFEDSLAITYPTPSLHHHCQLVFDPRISWYLEFFLIHSFSCNIGGGA